MRSLNPDQLRTFLEVVEAGASLPRHGAST